MIPEAWYNVLADLPEPLPPALHPETGEPLGPENYPLFPGPLVAQEFGCARWVEIPAEVRRAYSRWRPTPLVRAVQLERRLRTPARIYFKDEGGSPPGSHKANTAIPQAFYHMLAGKKYLTTETGAGQWGCSVAQACSLFGLRARVFMVRLTYERKPTRLEMIRSWGGEVKASPSPDTWAGRAVLAADPASPGSIGIAISEAVEAARADAEAGYAFGSVLNFTLLHQSVIGLEVRTQLAEAGDEPAVLVACAGGGSNLAGLIFPYLRDRLRGRAPRFVAVEPWSCPTLTCGEYRHDSPDSAGLLPRLPMYTLGHGFVPAEIRACGLRYHAMAPAVSLLRKLGILEAAACRQRECFEAARLLEETEGIVVAPETAHAVWGAVREAVRCREENRAECIVFALSGHGQPDVRSYDDLLAGDLEGEERR